MPPTLIDGLRFPEGPRWHDGRLWIADHHAHEVLAVTSEGDRETIARLDDMPSGLGWLPDGSLLIVAIRSQRILKLDRGELTVHADLSGLGEGWLNDMVVDGEGRAYVGRRRGVYANAPADPAEWLILVQPDGSWRIVADGVVSPNGSVVTPDGATLVVAESRARRLSAWRIDADGSLTGRRVWAQFDTEVPDGICLDEDGAIWVAGLGTTLSRVEEGGRILETIAVEGGKPVACALGGEDGRTLFALVTLVRDAEMRALRTPADDALSTSRGRVDTYRAPAASAGWP